MFNFFKKSTPAEPQMKKLILKRYYCNNGNYAEVKKQGKVFKYGTTIGAVIDPSKPHFPPLFYTIEPSKMHAGKENNSDNPNTPNMDESTCIPAGEYKCTMTQSNRFKELLYLVKNTPKRKGVRIHGGNSIDNSEGCILPCTTLIDNFSHAGNVYDFWGRQSVKALEKMYEITLKKDFILIIDDKDQEENLKLILKYKGY
jgi:hypothetical protein